MTKTAELKDFSHLEPEQQKAIDKLDNGIAEMAKKRKSPVHRITPDSFRSHVQEMDHKDLFLIRESILTELERRRSAAEKLVEELRGGKV